MFRHLKVPSVYFNNLMPEDKISDTIKVTGHAGLGETFVLEEYDESKKEYTGRTIFFTVIEVKCYLPTERQTVVDGVLVK